MKHQARCVMTIIREKGWLQIKYRETDERNLSFFMHVSGKNVLRLISK